MKISKFWKGGVNIAEDEFTMSIPSMFFILYLVKLGNFGKKNINKKNNIKKYIDKNLGWKIYNEEFENYILYTCENFRVQNLWPKKIICEK